MKTSVKLACFTLLATSMLQIPAATSAFAADTLHPGQTLSNNGMLVSADGRFAFDMQSDGNLVLYNSGNGLWSSHTNGAWYNPNPFYSPYTYDPNNWYSAQYTVWAQVLRLDYNGHLYISDAGNTRSFWMADTNTWLNNAYPPPMIKPTGLVGDTLIMQSDGNCVLYDTVHSGGNWMPVWATNTGGR
ncbi:hypothetical protein [Tumebacillus permanentifrigoris]|uniref:Bulb-type lectin domain-containing protein n=1 Tax=Tumebacillus permanentifrigoris TaxID=378543 RepID=A0A316DRD8_9BACL|nr:hypothetical protein [Tumebacillus permanentifrigoris]PWK07026.1 hypothetical protein C7459_11899 [Tumebacillus permanentifrigoris]